MDKRVHGKKKRTSLSWAEELIAALNAAAQEEGTDNLSLFTSILLADALDRLAAAKTAAKKRS